MQHKLGDAEKSLKLAKNILCQQKTVEKTSSLFNFYHCQFTFYTHNNELINAEKSLIELAYLAQPAEREQVSETSLKRRKINIMRDSAKLDHLQAKELIKEENSKLSKELIERSLKKYLLCLEDAISLGWKRGVCYLHNKIADIYLDLAEDDREAIEKRWEFLNHADTHLSQGQNIAIRNHNQRRIAGYLLAHARLSMFKGDCLKESAQIDETYQEAMKHSEQARDKYRELNNKTKVKEAIEETYQEAMKHSEQAKDKYRELNNKTKVKECKEVTEKCGEQRKQLAKC
jgi:hypothetical protein